MLAKCIAFLFRSEMAILAEAAFQPQVQISQPVLLWFNLSYIVPQWNDPQCNLLIVQPLPQLPYLVNIFTSTTAMPLLILDFHIPCQ